MWVISVFGCGCQEYWTAVGTSGSLLHVFDRSTPSLPLDLCISVLWHASAVGARGRAGLLGWPRFLLALGVYLEELSDDVSDRRVAAKAKETAYAIADELRGRPS